MTPIKYNNWQFYRFNLPMPIKDINICDYCGEKIKIKTPIWKEEAANGVWHHAHPDCIPVDIPENSCPYAKREWKKYLTRKGTDWLYGAMIQ